MENDKIPGNDGLSKKFDEVFWGDVQIPLLSSVNDAFIKEALSTSQKQVVMKLIEKKNRFLKNWRPNSLLNTDMNWTGFKTISNTNERDIAISFHLTGWRMWKTEL